METLTGRYFIDDNNLKSRRTYIKLSAEDIRVLASLKQWAHKTAPRIARDMYGHQFAFKPTLHFFSQHAKNRGIDIPTLCQALDKS